MPNFINYIKALGLSSEKSRRLSHWNDVTNMSPKDQGDWSSMILPKVSANNWTPNVDIDYLQKMYDCHDLVYNCIELVSSTFAQGELKVRKYEDGKWRFVPDHPLQKVLNSPNSSMTGYDLRQAYVVHRLLFGTVALIILRDDMVEDGELNFCPSCIEDNAFNCPHIFWTHHSSEIKGLMPVHPDRLSRKTYNTKNGLKEFFVYDAPQSPQPMVIHPNNIITDPFYNTGGSFDGSSPTQKVQRWLEIDLGLTKQVGAYLQNNAIPSFMIAFKPNKDIDYGDPTELLENAKQKWMEKFGFGGRNQDSREAKSPSFLFGELDVHQIQDGLKDIVVKPLFYEIQNRISMAYNVPPGYFEFGQDHGSQSATIEQQEKNFYYRAIIKELISFRLKMKRYLLPYYQEEGEVLDLFWDLSEMGVASFLEKERKAEKLKYWELGLTSRDKTLEMLGEDPIGGELGDDYYRETVMSDGRFNNSEMGGTSARKPRGLDNRLKPNPQLINDSGIEFEE